MNVGKEHAEHLMATLEHHNDMDVIGNENSTVNPPSSGTTNRDLSIFLCQITLPKELA